MIYGSILLAAYSSYAHPLSPPPSSEFITTESQISITTEDDDFLVTEN